MSYFSVLDFSVCLSVTFGKYVKKDERQAVRKEKCIPFELLLPFQGGETLQYKKYTVVEDRFSIGLNWVGSPKIFPKRGGGEFSEKTFCLPSVNK